MRRRFLALAAAIGLASLASVVLIERMTRSAPGGSSPSTERPAIPPPPPLAAAARVPPRVPPPVAVPVPAPEPIVARAGEPERARWPAPVPVPGAARVDLSFKLDRRLTSGLHMGDRWVSPRTYTRTGDSNGVTVEARARVVGGGSRRSRAKAAWTASEPDMVEVSSNQGDEVELTVRRPGESRVTVNAGGASATLTVKAVEVRGALRVDIVR